MKLSVIVPTYNRKMILKKCLLSLFDQTISKSSYEIVIVDDSSTDGTEQLAKSVVNNCPCELRYFKQAKKGPAAARNVGIRNAQGRIVLFIGDDIIADKKLLKEHMDFHMQYPQDHYAMLGYVKWSPEIEVTKFMQWLVNGGPQFGYINIQHNKIVDYTHAYTCNISYKIRFLRQYGFFDEDFRYAVFEDTDLGYRLSQKGLVITYNKNAIGYHYHPTTLTEYCKRQKRYGEYRRLFFQKHPELKDNKEVTLSAPVIEFIKSLRRYAKIIGYRLIIKIANCCKLQVGLNKFFSEILQCYYEIGAKKFLKKNKEVKKR